MAKTSTNRNIADDLARNTQDAYSFNRYGFGAWRACCALLLRRGFTAEQVETIMRSTLTRYAADEANNYYRATSVNLARVLDQPATSEYLSELFAESAPAPVKPTLHLVWSR